MAKGQNILMALLVYDIFDNPVADIQFSVLFKPTAVTATSTKRVRAMFDDREENLGKFQ